MQKHAWQRISSAFLVAGLFLGFVQPYSANAAQKQQQVFPGQPVAGPTLLPIDTAGLPPAPTVEQDSNSQAPLRSLPNANLLPKTQIPSNNPQPGSSDPVVQSIASPESMPGPILNFEGINSRDGVLPPDTDGEVGKDHFVQMVNLSMAVYNTSGTLLYGPFHPSDLWPVGNTCRAHNDGDPVVLYDQLADRWLISQFALPNYPSGPFYECIGISRTGKPTNIPSDWYLYAAQVSSTKMNDYPKLSVWPDGYYMTANQFTNTPLPWAGAGVFVFERAKMLNGQAASFQYVDLAAVDSNFGGMLPADLDGSTPPPAGSPAFFFEVDDSYFFGAADAVRLWKFHVDWATPANSTFGLAGQPNAVLNVAPFDSLPCVVNGDRSCIPQKSSTVKLDSLGDRLMFRAAYRNFGDHESVVLNHTVKADGTDRAGVRWYEVRNPGATPAIYQQGTFAPPDGQYRWMGSLAMDHMGDIALGYSISSTSLDPSIRYTGRLVNDPLGTLTQGEATIVTGGGAQTHSSLRWGDYSAMSVDPVDDCTFWYTQEYIQVTGSATWRTRIASFKFPGCNVSTQGTLTGMVRDAATHAAIAGATIQASQGGLPVASATSGTDGSYSLPLTVGTYSVAGSAFGYQTSAPSNVQIYGDTTTTLNLDLTAYPTYLVSGQVTDSGTGRPLYAKIVIDGYPGDPLWTNPVTGAYQVSLPAGGSYTFHATAWVGGFLPYSSPLIGPLTSNLTLNIPLVADPVACTAPGYQLVLSICTPLAGGLVVGNISDQNTGLGLNGATISQDAGGSTTSAGTPQDPGQGEGFYTLFSPAGSHTVHASQTDYIMGASTVAVPLNGAIRQNFSLAAGRLTVSPSLLYKQMLPNTTRTLPVHVTNTGSAPATINLVELTGAALASGPFQVPDFVVKPFKRHSPTAQELGLPAQPDAPDYPAGSVLNSWSPSLVGGMWGLAFDAQDGTLWLSSPSQAWGGDASVHELTPLGAATGRSHPYTYLPTSGPADAAYDWITRRLWVAGVDDGDCIYEIDPAAGQTGRQVCPPVTQYVLRGLAFDPTTDTFFAGGWGDSLIYRFDSSGRLLSQVKTNLAIAGMAYNPSTRHLFVITNAAPNPVYVLDVANDYAVLGKFTIPGFSDFGGAGLEFDANGSLWAVDQIAGKVYQVDAGESFDLGVADVPWLTELPLTATIPAGQTIVITITLDSTGLSLGSYQAQIKFEHNTPYSIPLLPGKLEVVDHFRLYFPSLRK